METVDPTLSANADPVREELPQEEEPVTTGTLFLMIIFLMGIAAVWGIMYLRLLER
jgi:hypothetical protein